MSFKDLTFRLFGEDKSASSSLGKLSKSAEDASSRIHKGFAPLGKIVAGVGLAAAAATAAIVATGIGEAMDASAGIAQLQAGIKSTGNVAHVTVGGMEDLASSIQNMSGQTDDSIVATEKLLLTFTNIRNRGPDKIFNQATLAAADMAAKMGGDASSKAVLLGKALNDPVKGITALTKVGVSFTAGQKASIKSLVEHGETVKAQKVILGELNKEFGGSAKAAGQSLPGQLQRARRAFEDVSQTVVETILPVVTPAIAGIADAVRSAQPFLQKLAQIVAKQLGVAFRELGPTLQGVGGFLSGLLPGITSLASWLAKNSQLILTVAAVVAGMVLSFKTFAAVLAVVNLLMSLTPLGVVALAVGALIVGIVLLVTHWKQVCAFLQDVWGGICKWFGDTLASIGTWWSNTWAGILGFIQRWGPLLLTAIAPIIGVPLLIIQHWGDIVAWFGRLPGVIGGLVAGAGKWLVDTGTKLLTGMRDGAITGLLALGRFVLDIDGKILGWVAGAGKWLVDTGTKLLTGMRDGAITGLVALGRFVLDIDSKVLGWVSGAGRWLIDTGTDLLHGLASGAKSGFSAVASFLGGIPKRITGALSGAGSLLLDIGRHIVDGLVQGLKNAWSGVTTAVHDLVNLIPAGARKLLGIASPSKVFKQIGKWVGEGFRDGIQGSKGDVLQAMHDLVSKVQDIPDKAFKRAGTTESAVVQKLRADTAAMVEIARKRDRLAGQLEKAQAKLDQAIDTRNGYRDTVSDGVRGLGSITGTTGQTDADGNTAAVTASDILAQKQTVLTKAKLFADQVRQLQSMGLNDDDYKSLVDQFQSTGDTSIAGALLAGGKSAVDQVNSLNSQLNASASQLGVSTSGHLYQAGVDSARSLRDGIQSQIDAVTGAMGVVEASIAKTLSSLGIDSSALSRQAGRDIADGVAVGLKDKRSALNDVFDDLADGWVKTIKKKLKIHSPSRVFRDEVGAHIPTGVADGIRLNAGAIDSELEAMVRVPSRYATAPGSTGLPGQIPTSQGGQAPLVHIDNFHATPEQSPAEIAADLGWLTRGGL